MRKQIYLVLLLLATINLYSLEQLLINFSDLRDTTVDFSDAAGEFWSEDKKELMKMDLKAENWRVRVNSSSFNIVSRAKSYAMTVKNTLEFPNQTILGVRVFFPERHANSYAEILPPFEIPSFYEDKLNMTGYGKKFHNKGIVSNVGILKKIGVKILGNNFKYALYVRIRNHQNEVKDIFLGFLSFKGWQERTWVNPHYDSEKKFREDKRDEFPYYPSEYPFIKLLGFVIHRADPEATGNFVTMFKEVYVDFDEHFLEIKKTEYTQESIFGIYKEELLERSIKEVSNVNKRIYFEWVENQRMYKQN